MGSRLEANSTNVRKRIENHTFENEEGEEYEASKFGGFNDYFRRKKIKLQNLDAELRSTSTDKPQVFRGIVAHVNGYTQPSLNDLHALIVSHGGGFMQYLDGKTTVTHIIASSLTPKKKVEFQKYRIVKPAWIVDSVKAGRLLPWNAYRVVDEGVGQKVLGFENGQVVSQTNPERQDYRDQTDTSWYTSQVKDIVTSLDDDQRLDQPELPRVDPQEPPSVSHFWSSSTPSQVPNVDRVREGAQPTPAARDLQLLETAFDSSMERSIPKTPNEAQDVPPDSFEADIDAVDLEETAPDTTMPAPVSDLSKISAFDANPTDRPGSPFRKALTAEEHNALLLADPRMRKSSTVNPDFLRQYYQESRLHHLSTWKAELKAQLQAMALEKSSSQRPKYKPKPGSRRYVLHVDFDSFFAAVSLRKHPEFKDKPTVVAHGTGSGSEIASCNYPARAFGIKNGMWMKAALDLCPNLKVLPYDFKAYEEASRHFYKAICATDGIVQSVSIDEALVDITSLCLPVGGSDGKEASEGSVYREQAKADEVAQKLRDLIKEKTGCAVSVGIGGNILLAKVALKKAKPAGQYQIKPEEVLDFIGDLTVQDLPGVAYSIGGKLEEIGIKYVRDIRELTKERLTTTLGPKTGEKLWEYSRGIDRTEVGEQVIRKSVSAEINWGIRFVTQAQADEFVQALCDELHRRLIEQNVKGRQLTMKIMRRAADAPLDPPKHLGHGKCDTFNKSVVLGMATNAKDILGREAVSILRGFGFSPGELRGLGVQMTKLEPLKGSAASSVERSQRKLQFKSPSLAPKKALEARDPIEEVDSPRRPAALDHAELTETIVGAVPQEAESAKPLNVMGTQFIMPTQVDPKVLAELPEDIRRSFAPKVKVPASETSREACTDVRSRSYSPLVPLDIPTQSQLDPETLDALPEDVRAEVLAFYANPPKKGAQQVLPQSPRKPYTSFSRSKKLTTPTKKKSSVLFRSKPDKPVSHVSTLTQSNFVATRIANGATDEGSNKDSDTLEVSTEFLDALPEDIRREVIEQQKRERLKKRSGLDLGTRKKKFQQPEPSGAGFGQRRLRLPSRPERPTFTAKKLSALPELRDAMTAWFEEFTEEGPFDEDVDALIAYLKRVVLEERDMNKSVSLVKWLGWLVEQAPSQSIQSVWVAPWTKIQDGVQDAVKQRGLAAVDFE